MSRRDKMAATFGAAYWRRPAADPAEAAVHLVRRKWHRLGRQLTGAVRVIVPGMIEAFAAAAAEIRRQAETMQRLRARYLAMQLSAARAWRPLGPTDVSMPAESDPSTAAGPAVDSYYDEPDDGVPYSWADAQRVRPEDYDDTEWTLGRIDQVLAEVGDNRE